MFFRRNSDIDWIVVFLGNPGLQYKNTRHNAGFMTADEIAGRKNIKLGRLKFHALTGSCNFSGTGALLMKPTTYMNLSGTAAGQAAAFHKIPPERIIVVSDDVALPLGTVRVRRKGSSGGHRGLQSIISTLGTQEFPRIKIGVGMPSGSDIEIMDWVLGSFTENEAKTIGESVARAARAVETYITQGAENAMMMFNSI
jgi:PTH1 family peptidyl-tRNA hydrolase